MTEKINLTAWTKNLFILQTELLSILAFSVPILNNSHQQRSVGDKISSGVYNSIETILIVGDIAVACTQKPIARVARKAHPLPSGHLSMAQVSR